MYDTVVEVEFYTGVNATGTKIYERKEMDAPKLQEVNVPAMGILHQQVHFAFGGGFQSVKVNLRDRYRSITYPFKIYNMV